MGIVFIFKRGHLNKKLAKTKPQLEILRLWRLDNNFYENQLVCKIVHEFQQGENLKQQTIAKLLTVPL